MDNPLIAKSVPLHGANDGLDFEDVRAALLRIPEISMRLRSAQRVLDRERRFDVDLLTFMGADHVTFRSYGHLRTWVAEIIKDGLCERLLQRAGVGVGAASTSGIESDSSELISPARHLPSLLNAVVAADPELKWFWPSLAGAAFDQESAV